MAKKNYVRPVSEAISLEPESSMLTGSDTMDKTNSTQTNAEDALTNKRSWGNNLWEE